MAVVGVGIDVVDVSRMAVALERTPSLLHRVFLDTEVAGGERPERLAVRFAAKEAARKALGATNAVRWQEIEVISGPGGRPLLRVMGETGRVASEAGIRVWHVSLSHDGGVAMAVVVAES